MISVRNETPADREQIRSLTIEAFEQTDFGHNGEADLIDSLRTSCQLQVSLVACQTDNVVGHILMTGVTVRTPDSEHHGMGLAPMSVAPQYQRTGIGTKLIQRALRQVFDQDVRFVVVLGHADYYSRFGFVHASQFGMSHGFAGIPQDVFFVRPGPKNNLVELAGGRVLYHSDFGHQLVQEI